MRLIGYKVKNIITRLELKINFLTFHNTVRSTGKSSKRKEWWTFSDSLIKFAQFAIIERGNHVEIITCYWIIRRCNTYRSALVYILSACPLSWCNARCTWLSVSFE